MAQEFGADAAKDFGDAHEMSTLERNTTGERLMDLYNNAIGRQLASDPANQGQDPEEVVVEAMKPGLLQLSPFVTNPSGR